MYNVHISTFERNGCLFLRFFCKMRDAGMPLHLHTKYTAKKNTLKMLLNQKIWLPVHKRQHTKITPTKIGMHQSIGSGGRKWPIIQRQNEYGASVGRFVCMAIAQCFAYHAAKWFGEWSGLFIEWLAVHRLISSTDYLIFSSIPFNSFLSLCQFLCVCCPFLSVSIFFLPSSTSFLQLVIIVLYCSELSALVVKAIFFFSSLQ